MPKMNVNSLITKDYRKNDCLAPQKTNPKQTQSKPALSVVEWANPELAEALSAFILSFVEVAEGAVEKFLSLCPESATIIRKVRSPKMATFRNSDKDNSGTQSGWVRSKFGDSLPCQHNILQKR